VDVPKSDGAVIAYRAVDPALATPRIYYVNGIQTDGPGHARAATVLSTLTEHVVYGVYNATGGLGPVGMVTDLLQCAFDWSDVFLSKLSEIGNLSVNKAVNGLAGYFRQKRGLAPPDPFNLAEEIRRRVPEQRRVEFIEWCVARYNRATASLFRQLYTHAGEKQLIVAHSQGNLITADALWSMVIAYGERSLERMQVYSLASPAPAWPLGIRYKRKVYGHTNDLVTLADPHNWTWVTGRVAGGKFGRTAGDWRQFGPSGLPGLAGHDLTRNMTLLNFARRIRQDLGLPPLTEAAPGP
jgi:hypothetical protein